MSAQSIEDIKVIEPVPLKSFSITDEEDEFIADIQLSIVTNTLYSINLDTVFGDIEQIYVEGLQNAALYIKLYIENELSLMNSMAPMKVRVMTH